MQYVGHKIIKERRLCFAVIGIGYPPPPPSLATVSNIDNLYKEIRRAGHKLVVLLLVTVFCCVLPLLVRNNHGLERMNNNVTSNDLNLYF